MYKRQLLNTARAKKSTAIALKTRVYLQQNEFQKVVEEAAKLVSKTAPFQYTTGSLTHRLETNIAAIFGGSYTGSEAIFSIPFANTTTETPPSQSSLAFTYVSQPILFLATGGIVSDPALTNVADARASLIGTNSAGQKVLRKFNITTAPFRDYVPVIRYAEVMLNYAEAAAQTNDLSMAAALLKAVRNRSNPNHIFAETGLTSKTTLLNLMFNERRIELLGEGFRLHDLQRRLSLIHI